MVLHSTGNEPTQQITCVICISCVKTESASEALATLEVFRLQLSHHLLISTLGGYAILVKPGRALQTGTS